MSRKAHSKTTKRAQDLLQMIELDVSSYDLFDLPPVKEYDLYIRSFGRTDTKQVPVFNFFNSWINWKFYILYRL